MARDSHRSGKRKNYAYPGYYRRGAGAEAGTATGGAGSREEGEEYDLPVTMELKPTMDAELLQEAKDALERTVAKHLRG